MRKMLSVVLAGLLITGFCSLVLAEEKKESTMGKGMMQGSMMGKQGMMGEEGMMMSKDKMMRMDTMRGMMNSMMTGKSLVATSDGGVIVLIGNKLQKYDKDLVLQKEVEIKIDMEGMKKTMMQMMEKGGMMGQAKEESRGTETSSESSGQGAHH